MATMIPVKPNNFEPASQEGLMFEALDLLPQEYYVFHSFRLSVVSGNTFHESETDFLVFHPQKGVICLEAKAGQVRYQNGCWLYGNGTPMHNGGPFNQASSNKWKLIKYIEHSRMHSILDKCKFLHAVWFPAINDNQLCAMILPSEGDKNIVLTKEALSDPLPYIERVFEIELPNRIETNLTKKEEQLFVREILCPQFDVFPTSSFESDLKKMVFHRLLKEQSGILNFLDDQRVAVINGAAGTGKTMIAVEKAFRHASDEEKVLFLCYNNQLKAFLAETHPNEYIDYYTISGFACKLCSTATPDYGKLRLLLDDMYLSESFPYRHVIVDEGQDFGIEDINESDILQMLKDIIADSANDKGSFYVFYDRLQLVQGKRIPKYIADADCRLTLYRNCRNTENIAVTSLRPISERKPKLFDGSIKGAPAKIHFCDSKDTVAESLDSVLNIATSEGIMDIVILTCKTEETSILGPAVSNGLYKGKYKFTTCRKFKGLEADLVVLTDLEKETFIDDNVFLYYVGASRARIKLDMITTMTDDDCSEVLRGRFNVTSKIKRPKKELASVLNSIGSLDRKSEVAITAG